MIYDGILIHPVGDIGLAWQTDWTYRTVLVAITETRDTLSLEANEWGKMKGAGISTPARIEMGCLLFVTKEEYWYRSRHS